MTVGLEEAINNLKELGHNAENIKGTFTFKTSILSEPHLDDLGVNFSDTNFDTIFKFWLQK